MDQGGKGSAAQAARARLVAALERVAERDHDALHLVYDLTSAKLFGICLRICRDREVAEDILQTVYIKIWDRAGRFDPGRASPITWLATIARNTAIDWRRASGGAATVQAEAALDMPDQAPLADAAIEAGETRARIHHCLETLEARQRGAIRSAFFDGFTYAELAEQASVPLGTMKSWIRRGLQRLKACLDDG